MIIFSPEIINLKCDFKMLKETYGWKSITFQLAGIFFSFRFLTNWNSVGLNILIHRYIDTDMYLYMHVHNCLKASTALWYDVILRSLSKVLGGKFLPFLHDDIFLRSPGTHRVYVLWTLGPPRQLLLVLTSSENARDSNAEIGVPKNH